MEKQICPKCKDPNAYKANTKYGAKLRCNACNGWFPYVTQPQEKIYTPDKPPQLQPVKNDREASIGALAFTKSAMGSPEICNQLFTGQGLSQVDLEEKIWEFYIKMRERLRKYE